MTSQEHPRLDPEQAAREQKQAKRDTRRRLLLRGLAAVVVLVGIIWALYHFLVGRWYESTDDAYVNGNVVQITPQIPGTVVSIGADDNDYVREGQPLVKLDRSDAQVALAQAEADLAASVRKVRGLYSGVSSSQADVAAREVAVAQARADYKRREGLARTGAISAEELSHAREALTAAESGLAAVKGQLATTRALVENTQVASHPEVQAAAAKVRAAYLDLQRDTLVAPVSGHVAKRSVQVGQRVQPGTPLMAVVPLTQVWVDANFKETQLTDMRIGQPVTLTSDLYGGGVEYHGRVEGLGVGTGSAFSLLPAQNATGNWIKIVQRLPVRIAINPDELQKHPLRIGLSMDAEVNLHNQNGPILSRNAPAKPVLSTDVYQRSSKQADALIAKIVAENSEGPATGSKSGTGAN
jgi:membrane fusion protein (multidrug efflux system)